MTRPYIALFTRDWLDDKLLRKCSPLARSILLDLMCLMHEGKPYGYLTDEMGNHLDDGYLIGRLSVTSKMYHAAIDELVSLQRINISPSGLYFCARMVKDEDIRLRRAAGGSRGGNPSLKVNHLVNYMDNTGPHACASRAESVIVNSNLATEIKTLTGKYQEFLIEWQKPNSAGKVFSCADVDLGCQAWMSLIDAGKITAANIPQIFEGLARWKESTQWKKGMVHSVPTWLGYAKNGTPAAPRWNDKPEQIAPEGEY